MTEELQAMRERFRDQMPGLAVFDELLAKYERLLHAQTAIEQRWTQSAPERVTAVMTQLQDMLDTADLPPETKEKLATVIKGGTSA